MKVSHLFEHTEREQKALVLRIQQAIEDADYRVTGISTTETYAGETSIPRGIYDMHCISKHGHVFFISVYRDLSVDLPAIFGTPGFYSQTDDEKHYLDALLDYLKTYYK